MAYRTYVGTTGKDSIQILGNNEYYQPFVDELKKQGYYVDSDGCYGIIISEDDVDSKCIPIKEIQPFIDILEQYIWEKDKEMNKYFKDKEYKVDIFNLRPDKEFDKDLTFRMKELQENAYIFVTANLVNYLKDNIDMKYDIENKKYIYKIKEGKEIWFEAY